MAEKAANYAQTVTWLRKIPRPMNLVLRTERDFLKTHPILISLLTVLVQNFFLTAENTRYILSITAGKMRAAEHAAVGDGRRRFGGKRSYLYGSRTGYSALELPYK